MTDQSAANPMAPNAKAEAATEPDRAHPVAFLTADRPIERLDDDLLGRRGFAETLAKVLTAWQGKDSLVIALYGNWGSGKSSIKNMALDSLTRLAKTKANTPVVINFNPWEFSNRGQLVEAFFREVGASIGRADGRKRFQKLAAKFREYGVYLTSGASILGAFRKPLTALLLVAAAITGAGYFLPSGMFRAITLGLAIVFLALVGVLNWAGSIARSISEILQARADSKQMSAEERKDELKRLLAANPRTFLVVMDDIDRLSKEEVRELLQVVKSNADFPKMIYLLLGQRDILEKSLEALAPVSGREFLEKIVQVPFDVPDVERSRVQEVLFKGLDLILAAPHLEKRFDEGRWANVFLSGVQNYFSSLRDVRRYLGVLAFHFELLRSGGSSEVNPIDLIALETLRVFEPDVYARMPLEKATLTQRVGAPLSTPAGEEERKHRFQELLKLSAEPNRGRVESILVELFPQTSPLVSDQHRYQDDEGWIRDLRVCAPGIFDRYFQFAIPRGELSQADLDRILDNAGDRNELVEIFDSLRERGLLADALDRLEAYKQKLDLANAKPFVTALFDIGDTLPEGKEGWFVTEPGMHAVRIIHWYLKTDPDKGHRAEILEAAIRDTRGLYLPVMKVSIESDGQGGRKDVDAFLVENSRVRPLQVLCLTKIQAAAKDGRLAGHTKMLYILYRWKEWADPEEARRWVDELTKEPKGLVAFLGACTQKIRTAGGGDRYVRISWRIRIQDIEEFIPANTIQQRLDALTAEAMTEEGRQAKERFSKARAGGGELEDDAD